ncbi:SseB family protein [Microbacterium sp. CIAB417]|uniref:SseB family protein n=1 Tax=Microbacterium sp. CIAB417 TaxID=2860287 RepID=UPI001FAC7B28|nr:SseB family protein [Microbacterium sp. CIAB417]
MALFSRRKKSADDAVPVTEPASVDDDATAAAADAVDETPEAAADVAPEAEAAAPSVGISVQAFRGVGADAGPEVALPTEQESARPAAAPKPPSSAPTTPAAPVKRSLPLAAALPPEQTETVPGMKDNVLLREALAELAEGATNEQLLGVLRQALQGHLYLRVSGDAREQISEGKPLSIAVVRDEDRSFLLAFSNAASVRDSVQRETDPTATSAVAQPVTSVIQQVISGGFTGMILDNASGAHRAVFPTEVLQKALDQADENLTIKTLLAGPREADTAARVGEALAATKAWVAVNDGSGSGQVGIAEAQTPDGKRFLQLFSHPLEVVALGRGDRPMPFAPEQLAKVLSTHPEMAGVLVDAAGPSIIVERDALAPVLVLAVDLGD